MLHRTNLFVCRKEKRKQKRKGKNLIQLRIVCLFSFSLKVPQLFLDYHPHPHASCVCVCWQAAGGGWWGNYVRIRILHNTRGGRHTTSNHPSVNHSISTPKTVVIAKRAKMKMKSKILRKKKTDSVVSYLHGRIDRDRETGPPYDSRVPTNQLMP